MSSNRPVRHARGVEGLDEATMPLDDDPPILAEAGDNPDIAVPELRALDRATDELDALTDADAGAKTCAEHARPLHVVHTRGIGDLGSDLNPGHPALRLQRILQVLQEHRERAIQVHSHGRPYPGSVPGSQCDEQAVAHGGAERPPFAGSPVFLVGDSAIGSPYFQSISLGFECAMFLAGLIAQRDLPIRDMLVAAVHLQAVASRLMRSRMIKHNKDLFESLDDPLALLDKLHIY